MSKHWASLRALVARQTLFYWIFSLAISFGAILLLSAVALGKPSLSTSDRVALFAGLLATAVVWWQGHLIARQMVLGAVIELYREWNSEGMAEKRRKAWTSEGPNPQKIEGVLEFLEKVSTLEKNRFVSRQLVWDTFGWYLGRYYFYCKNEIQRLRLRWTPRGDATLYQDLDAFYKRLIAFELRERNRKRKPRSGLITGEDIETEFQQTRKMFIAAEREEHYEDD
ncbi:MAG: hypothetical protein WA857_05150 [Candidatus Acidiferrum sp.]